MKSSRRSEKSKKTRENKKKLGNSIEQRPDDVDTREEFGHWEIDSVIGKKTEGESHYAERISYAESKS